MNDQGDFDSEALARLTALGGEKLVRGIVALFTGFAAARVEDAESASAAGNCAGVAAAAHALRSSAGNVGAMRLYSVATDLELAARSGHAELVPGLVTRLRSAYDGARAQVLDFVPGGAS